MSFAFRLTWFVGPWNLFESNKKIAISEKIDYSYTEFKIQKS